MVVLPIIVLAVCIGLPEYLIRVQEQRRKQGLRDEQV